MAAQCDGGGASSPAQRAACAVASSLPGADRRGGAGVRRGQAPARVLRAAGRRRPGTRSRRSCDTPASAGLLVIADGKRGDIDVTARAYAQALFGGVQTPFGEVAGLGADMATVNPLMGADAVEPFVTAARAAGAGVLVLVRTSNPGAADVEDLAGRAARGPYGSGWRAIVDELGAPRGGRIDGLSDVGAVVGATAPGHIARARELMPHAVFLLPGVGAQGGRVEDLAPAFAPGRAGGLVTRLAQHRGRSHE